MLRSKLLAFDDSGAATNARQRTAQPYRERDEILSSFDRAAEKAPCPPMMSAAMLFEAPGIVYFIGAGISTNPCCNAWASFELHPPRRGLAIHLPAPPSRAGDASKSRARH